MRQSVGNKRLCPVMITTEDSGRGRTQILTHLWAKGQNFLKGRNMNLSIEFVHTLFKEFYNLYMYVCECVIHSHIMEFSYLI